VNKRACSFYVIPVLFSCHPRENGEPATQTREPALCTALGSRLRGNENRACGSEQERRVLSMSFPFSFYVIPVKTGNQQRKHGNQHYAQLWVPAYAGMRRRGGNEKEAREQTRGKRGKDKRGIRVHNAVLRGFCPSKTLNILN
jgi:hypothetical protein